SPRPCSFTASASSDISPLSLHDALPISNGGQIVLSSASTLLHRELIVSLAARHRLPAVYTDRVFVAAGGLTSYGQPVAGCKADRSEEHTSELQSLTNLVCRLLLAKQKPY